MRLPLPRRMLAPVRRSPPDTEGADVASDRLAPRLPAPDGHRPGIDRGRRDGHVGAGRARGDGDGGTQRRGDAGHRRAVRGRTARRGRLDAGPGRPRRPPGDAPRAPAGRRLDAGVGVGADGAGRRGRHRRGADLRRRPGRLRRSGVRNRHGAAAWGTPSCRPRHGPHRPQRRPRVRRGSRRGDRARRGRLDLAQDGRWRAGAEGVRRTAADAATVGDRNNRVAAATGDRPGGGIVVALLVPRGSKRTVRAVDRITASWSKWVDAQPGCEPTR